MRESFYKSVHFHFLNLVSLPTRLSSSQHPENREIWPSDVLFQASGAITFYSNRDKHYLLSIVWKEPLQWKGHWPWVKKESEQKMPNITYMYIVCIFSPIISEMKWICLNFRKVAFSKLTAFTSSSWAETRSDCRCENLKRSLCQFCFVLIWIYSRYELRLT